MQFLMKVAGLSLLTNKFNFLGKSSPGKIHQATVEATLFAFSKIPPYPPPPPRSTYIRTGTLGRSFTQRVQSIGTDSVGIIGTRLVYAPDVVSNKPIGNRGGQAWYHRRTGWWTLQAVILGLRSDIIKIYERVLNRTIKGK